MHFYEKKLIELGGIDTEIVRIHIDDWFENVTIAYIGKNNKEVICNFKQCFEISLRHDRDYSKEKNSDGNLDYTKRRRTPSPITLSSKVLFTAPSPFKIPPKVPER